LICDPRAFSIKLNVDTVPLRGHLEKFAGGGDGSRVWVLGVVDTLGLGQSPGRQLTYEPSANRREGRKSH
jgi:hypothetical protein